MLPFLLRPKGAYFTSVRRLFGSSLIAYYPRIYDGLDISGNGLNGTPTAVTAGVGIGDGLSSGVFDGATSYVSLPAGFITAFPYTEGSLLIWSCIDSYDVWLDATARRLLEFIDNDGSDYIRLYKDTIYNRIGPYYRFGDIASHSISKSATSSGFIPLVFTWSRTNNRTRLYNYGRLRGSSTFSDDLLHAFTHVNIGCSHPPIASGWLGRIAHFATGNTELTQAQVTQLSQRAATLFTILGDSVSYNSGHWASRVTFSYPTNAGLLSHAVTGNSIISGMDAQVVEAAVDDSDMIIIELGTNDDNAGNMATLQAEAEENIVELKASNPRAVIYWMNVLPRWTDNGGLTEVAKGNIRTAIAAACTSQSIICWDTYTAPWITAAQTLDGLHPNAAGHAAIAAQVLARL